MKRATLRQIEQQVERWNSRYPAGSDVIYHPVIGEPDGIRTTTTTLASVLSGHTAVVFVQHKSGCVALDALTPKIHTKTVESGYQPQEK